MSTFAPESSRATPSSDPSNLVVVVRSPQLRERVRDALAQAGTKAAIVVDPEEAVGEGLVVCERGGATDRVRLLAAGADRVVDAGSGPEQLARAIGSVAQVASSRSSGLDRLATSSPAMQRLVHAARQLLQVSTPVLITGERGVGKEHLARTMHAESDRAEGPFVTIDCGALPSAWLESQLVGPATGGTVLLDEIGAMPLELQLTLLTVLERHQVVPVGASEPVPVDVRILAATDRDLHRAVEQGTFRADLFDRLNVVRLEVPPLRERLEDVPELAGRALRELRNVNPERRVTGITADALQALCSHTWPGNVAELRSVVERAVLLGSGHEIQLDDLPHPIRSRPDHGLEVPALVADLVRGRDWLNGPLSVARQAAIEEVERAYLREALRATRGRIAKTADMAGIGTRSLYDKLKRYGLRKEDFKVRAASRRV